MIPGKKKGGSIMLFPLKKNVNNAVIMLPRQTL